MVNNIDNYISPKIFTLLESTFQKVYKANRQILTPIDLLEVILEEDSLLPLFSKMKVKPEDILLKLTNLNRHSTSKGKIKTGKVILSPDTKIVLLRAIKLAGSLNFNTINLPTLLFSLCKIPAIKKILENLGVDLSFIEEEIEANRANLNKKDEDAHLLLKNHLIDIHSVINKKTKIIGREKELSQLVRILIRSNKNNVIIAGETGVGKSSIIYLLAQNLDHKKLTKLKELPIYEFDLLGMANSLMLRNIGNFIEIIEKELRNIGNAIFFIKDYELKGKKESFEKVLTSQIIRILLESPRSRVIISMTSKSLKTFNAQNGKLFNKFEVVKIKEPSISATTQILQENIPKLSSFHSINIKPDVPQEVAELAKRYIHEKHLPEKAIDLLDESCSKASLDGKKSVSIIDVQKVVSEKTGIPTNKLSTTEKTKLLNLEQQLNSVLIGQKEAVHSVSEVIRRSRAGLKDPGKPIGSFLFLGPSGVGKTYLAQNLTQIIYDSQNAMIRIDMSEFGEPHTVQRLIGPPPGYVGYDEGGQLTNPVWERPYSLILLDEIEKANPKVFDIFLQLLDEGRLTDGQGRTVDFKNTIIIATSNIASEEILDLFLQKGKSLSGFDKEEFLKNQIIPILKSYFRPEFINRFDDIIVFNELGVEELFQISKLQIKKIQKRLEDKQITLNVSNEKLMSLAKKAYNPTFGARQLIRLIQNEIENIVAHKIISGEINQGETVNIE